MTPAATSEVTVSVVVVVHNRLALTRACLESLRQTARPFELCVVDNGSSDETPSYFRRWSGEPPLRYQRNPENVGLISGLNQGAALARGDHLCFLHNDTELLDPYWLGKLAAAVGAGRKVGLAGLYGARYVRRDGTFLGRSIVHCLAEGPTMRAPVVEVAVVDGVCLFVPRAMLAEIGGFDESYGFLHGYDRDLSLAVRATGRRCVVVEAASSTGAAGRARVPERRSAPQRISPRGTRPWPVSCGSGDTPCRRTRVARGSAWLTVCARS